MPDWSREDPDEPWSDDPLWPEPVWVSDVGPAGWGHGLPVVPYWYQHDRCDGYITARLPGD
jgi:hypothetical protein